MHVKGTPDRLELTGSGRTTVSRAYPGLASVDVDGVPTDVVRGRLTTTVDLGAPNAMQQYTPGAAVPRTATKGVSLAPHAVIRIGRATRVKHGIRVCARVIGGEVRRARITSGGRERVVALDARTRCRSVPAPRARTVTVSGRDGYGHAVRATERLPAG